MLHVAALLTQGSPDVLRPSPAGLVGRPPDENSSDGDQFELALFERAHLVGRVEVSQNDVMHGQLLSTTGCLASGRPVLSNLAVPCSIRWPRLSKTRRAPIRTLAP